jgi:peptide chain release factor
MRADAVNARAVNEPAAYEQHIQLAREIADVLRRNVVQAVKVTESADQSEERDKWSE